MPKFSIILPVRNGGMYVKDCVKSILNQTHRDFNLIVLDNCSEDGTLEWINSLNDHRIITYPSDKPLGIEGNWARVTAIPKNEFITLIGHDDIMDPEYLAVMDKLIFQYPDASLYQAHFRYIDQDGKTIRHCKPMNEKQNPTEVLSGFLTGKTDIMGTGFMMRSKDYDAVGGIPAYPKLLFADFELWINLARIHYLAVATEETFAFRIHQSTTTSAADSVMLDAFDRFIEYLVKLKSENPDYKKVITENTNALLNFHCQGLTSRVLRTGMKKRNGQTVKGIIDKFRIYAERLAPGSQYDPIDNKVVRMALFIDTNFISRNLFLLFKKIYPKPVAG